MKNNLFFLLFFISQFGFSQVIENSQKSERKGYARIDFSVPVSVNDDYDGPLLNVDGVNGRFGVGKYIKNWVGLGANIGVDWIANEGLVVVPMFGTLSLQPKVSKEFRLFIEPGYGITLAIGKDGLKGDFKKISLGIGDDEGELYMQVSQYGFSRFGSSEITSFSFGLRFQLFKPRSNQSIP